MEARGWIFSRAQHIGAWWVLSCLEKSVHKGHSANCWEIWPLGQRQWEAALNEEGGMKEDASEKARKGGVGGNKGQGLSIMVSLLGCQISLSSQGVGDLPGFSTSRMHYCRDRAMSCSGIHEPQYPFLLLISPPLPAL